MVPENEVVDTAGYAVTIGTVIASGGKVTPSWTEI